MSLSANRSLLPVAFVLFLALLPLWLVRYPPLYDYPAHLLEAQVVARYSDMELQYAAGYRLNEGWPFTSNALSTLLMAGVATVLPAELAGRLVLSLYIVLFVGGMALLLRRSGAVWPLLLLAPLLAWNLAFTSGWLNFSYAVALGMFMLAVFQAWARNPQQWQYLVALALLSACIAMAHLFGWALWAIIIAAMAAAGSAPRRHTHWLLGALGLPLLPALAAQPLLALLWATIPLLVWGTIALALWLRLTPGYLLLLSPFVAVGCYSLGAFFDSSLTWLDPKLIYNRFARTSFLFRSFTLPQQTTAMSEITLIAGLSALLLLLILAALFIPGVLQRVRWQEPWLAAIATLIVCYGLVPSASSMIEIVEPRVVLIGALVALVSVGLPKLPGLQTLISSLAIVICGLWLVAVCSYSLDYDRRANQWRTDLSLLDDARRVLTLHTATPDTYNSLMALNWFYSAYDGAYFSSYYFIEQGGYTTRMFGNGPIWLHDHVPGWIYYFPQPEGAIGHAEEQCALAKNNFDAVLAWGPLDQQLVAMLTTCLGEPETRGMVTVWR
jgi:hypothetical protein